MRIITFSGIDGAGKSTQIAALKKWLTEEGLSIKYLSFWDDVVMFSDAREFATSKVFHGDQGIGSPERPLHRRDKNISAWPLTVIRLFLYFADCINLRRMVNQVKRAGSEVLIFDRYIYDELANLSLNRWLIRAFCRLMLKISPTPTIALLIDAEPEDARARKPEYPLEFLHHNRNAYLALSRIAREIVVLEPQTMEAAQGAVKRLVLSKLSLSEPELARVCSTALRSG